MPSHPTLSSQEPSPGAFPPPPSSERRLGGLTPVTLFLTLLIAYLVVKVQLVVVLVLLAILFATIIERPVVELEKRRIPRGFAILLVYIAIIGSIVLLSLIIAPVISEEADTFKREAPDQLAQLQAQWRTSPNPILNGPGEELLGRAIDAIADPPEPGQDTAMNVLISIGGAIVGIMTALVVAFYYLMEKALLRRLILQQLRAENRTRVARVWDDVEAQVGRWLRGQLTLCLIIGTTSTIGYGLMGVRFWPLLGLVAGITEAIPIVGPWLGGIPAVIIALTQSWEKALMVAIFVICLQLLENTVLVPRVMRGAVGLTPLTVFVAILVGTQFMNVVGAILAIPLAAAVQVIVTDYLKTRREARRASDVQLPGWRWMRGHLVTQVPQMEPPPQPEPPEEARAPVATKESPGWTSHLLARVSGHGSEGPATRTESPSVDPQGGPNGGTPSA
jgi:predicted PurR-regulated permease PerM